MARRASVFPILVLLVPACATVRHEQFPVVPGLSLRFERRVGPDTILYQRSITRGGRDSITGTRTVVLETSRAAAHERLLQVVQRFPGGGGEIVDTATVWVDSRTHAALRVRYDITARALSYTDERVTPLPG